MNPHERMLYAGLAGARVRVDEFHFGHGIALSRTFAHLSAPFLAGFLPRPPRDAVYLPEARSFDVVAQLHVPEEARPVPGLDRVNTVWWLAVLLRLRISPRLTVVGLSSEPFGGDPRTWAEPRRVELDDPALPCEISEEDLEWVRRHWLAAGILRAERRELRRSLRFFDRSCFAPGPAEALQSLWDALAALFLPHPDDDGTRLTEALAVFLGVPPAERAAFRESAGELLEARLASLEGATEGFEEPVRQTCALARRALVQILESGYMPTYRELETGLGPH